jgi:hypothetical protein
MTTYSVRTFAHVEGPSLSRGDEQVLLEWITKNEAALIAVWDADIEYTEDLMEKLQPR